MNITVVIPTYFRPNSLKNCLIALQKQIRKANQIIVIIRDIDHNTLRLLKTIKSDFILLEIIIIKVPGVVAAMNAGLKAALGDIIAFTDDDAVPHSDWLAWIEVYFLSGKNIGAVGGRDWVYFNNQLEDRPCHTVGKVQWFGRVIGNHHLGKGLPRQVDVLKGVNMSFRRTAITDLFFDERMRGNGAQVHFELAFSLTIKRRGWQIIYDPLVAVNHYPQQRFDEDIRGEFNVTSLTNAVHNETLILMEHFSPLRRMIFLLWSILIGTSTARGILLCLRFLPKEGKLSIQKFMVALKGRWQGYKTWQESRLFLSKIYH